MFKYKPKKGQPDEFYIPRGDVPPVYRPKFGNLYPKRAYPTPEHNTRKTSRSMARVRVPRRKTFLIRPGDTVEVISRTSPRCLIGRVAAYVPGEVETSPTRYIVDIPGYPQATLSITQLRLIRGGPKGTQPIPKKAKRKKLDG